jgi:hypothetical protein
MASQRIPCIKVHPAVAGLHAEAFSSQQITVGRQQKPELRIFHGKTP